MPNGYRTGHADVSCMMHLCYNGTGLRQGRALNGARSVTVADDSFPVLATLTLHISRTFSEALQTPTNSSTELPTVHTLDKHSARPCHFLLPKHKQVLSYRKSMCPSCPPAAGPLQRKYKRRAGLGVIPLRIVHGTF